MLATPNSLDTIASINYKHLLKRRHKNSPNVQSSLTRQISQHKQSPRFNQYGQKLYIRSSFLNPIENLITMPENLKQKKRKDISERKVKTQATVIQDGNIEKYRQNRLPEIRKSLAHEEDIYEQVRNFMEFSAGNDEEFMRSSKYKRLKFHKTKFCYPKPISNWKRKEHTPSIVEKTITSPRVSGRSAQKQNNNGNGYKIKTQLIKERRNLRIDSEKLDEIAQLPIEKLQKFEEKLRRQASLSPLSSLVTQTRVQAIYQCQLLKAAKHILGKNSYERINLSLYKDSKIESNHEGSQKQLKNITSHRNLKKRKYDRKNVKDPAEKRQNVAEMALKINLQRLRNQKQKVFEKISL